MASRINNEAEGFYRWAAAHSHISGLTVMQGTSAGCGRRWRGQGNASSAAGLFPENQASQTDSFICCDVDLNLSPSGYLLFCAHTHFVLIESHHRPRDAGVMSSCHSLTAENGPDTAPLPSDSQQHTHILRKTVFTRKTQNIQERFKWNDASA